MFDFHYSAKGVKKAEPLAEPRPVWFQQHQGAIGKMAMQLGAVFESSTWRLELHRAFSQDRIQSSGRLK